MDDLKTTYLFATPLVEARVQTPGLVSELEQAIWMLEDGDSAGHRWCERQGYDGYTSYASLDDLPIRAPAFATLVTELDSLAAEFARDRDWDLSSHPLRLDALWVNILAEGGMHSGHIHPGSVISGTVYIDMPEGAGALKFEDPRLSMMQAAPPMRQTPSEGNQRFVYRTPQPGTVLLWESWLRHEVMPNRAETPRLTVSFNYGLSS